MKRFGTLSFASAAFALATFVSAAPAAAEEKAAAASKQKEQAEQSKAAPRERTLKIYTTDHEKGGVLNAKITWFPAKGGGYNGTIQGKYEDVEEDGYCVQGFKTGGKKRYPLGPPVCPKGQTFQFNDSFRGVQTALVEVSRINNKLHQRANCSGWK